MICCQVAALFVAYFACVFQRLGTWRAIVGHEKLVIIQRVNVDEDHLIHDRAFIPVRPGETQPKQDGDSLYDEWIMISAPFLITVILVSSACVLISSSLRCFFCCC